MENFESVLQAMKPISLDEMESIKLMNRIDTKFIANRDRLVDILAMAHQHGYYAQEINGCRIAKYDTLYYDTADLAMYTMHHNRHLRRQKIRIRKYLGSDLTFLEVKNKTNTGRTKKKRRRIPEGDFPLNLTTALNDIPDVQAFIAEKSRFAVETLLPQLHTQFSRITLVNNAHTERLTIDFNLVWVNDATLRTMTFEKLIIIELKQDGHANSEMKDILLSLRIHPAKMSKYCIGVALTNPQSKLNRFKPKIRKIKRLTSN